MNFRNMRSDRPTIINRCKTFWVFQRLECKRLRQIFPNSSVIELHKLNVWDPQGITQESGFQVAIERRRLSTQHPPTCQLLHPCCVAEIFSPLPVQTGRLENVFEEEPLPQLHKPPFVNKTSSSPNFIEECWSRTIRQRVFRCRIRRRQAHSVPIYSALHISIILQCTADQGKRTG